MGREAPHPPDQPVHGRYWLVGKLVSQAVVLTKDGVHYQLPRWLSFGSMDYEFPFACTVKAFNPPAL